jgi:DNA polymerase III alpha subunit
MDNCIQDLNKYTELKNRKLFYDGDSIVNVEFLYDFLLDGNSIQQNNIYINNIDKEIKQYNEYFEEPLTVKNSIKEYSNKWNIPKEYKNINIVKKINQLLKMELIKNDFTDDEMRERIIRVNYEMTLFKERKMADLLKTLIYIIDVFKEKNIVWGTGRGSSCCCYILYLIELHDVDSIFYNLDLKEFFR